MVHLVNQSHFQPEKPIRVRLLQVINLFPQSLAFILILFQLGTDGSAEHLYLPETAFKVLLILRDRLLILLLHVGKALHLIRYEILIPLHHKQPLYHVCMYAAVVLAHTLRQLLYPIQQLCAAFATRFDLLRPLGEAGFFHCFLLLGEQCSYIVDVGVISLQLFFQAHALIRQDGEQGGCVDHEVCCIFGVDVAQIFLQGFHMRAYPRVVLVDLLSILLQLADAVCRRGQVILYQMLSHLIVDILPFIGEPVESLHLLHHLIEVQPVLTFQHQTHGVGEALGDLVICLLLLKIGQYLFESQVIQFCDELRPVLIVPPAQHDHDDGGNHCHDTRQQRRGQRGEMADVIQIIQLIVYPHQRAQYTQHQDTGRDRPEKTYALAALLALEGKLMQVIQRWCFAHVVFIAHRADDSRQSLRHIAGFQQAVLAEEFLQAVGVVLPAIQQGESFEAVVMLLRLLVLFQRFDEIFAAGKRLILLLQIADGA